ncbi:hypothetical protein EW146_g5124 [Bondarzewia mesenterica]|uniref:Uncharacterized protein n=1 Tax=Bondarzewia mesenterica TaxID=1095465 RepID=A0A4S4LY73_9AGAM|nr:hypothetical protein EW146_g5124 [Bondarzewia mesenterica]
MPTATVTREIVTNSHIIPLKASLATSPSVVSEAQEVQTSRNATLRSLYSRAARAFLHRDVALTHSLLTSAFAILPPPKASQHDTFAEHRRKWDILRITLEVTVYTSPPDDTASIPTSLRTNAMLSPQSFVSALHARSLQLFTRADRPDAAYLPSQVLVTLALASMKTNCPLLGRAMIEEWLARRGQSSPYGYEAVGGQRTDGYEKVLDIYCLNVLPMLAEWDYAEEFLEYETELDPSRKQRLMSTLSAVHAQHVAALQAQPPSVPSTSSSQSTTPMSTALPTPSDLTPRPSRSPSPTPSTSSHSSTSTHTAVPLTPKARHSSVVNGLTPFSPSRPQTPLSSTATSRTITPAPGAVRPVSRFREHTQTSSSSSTSNSLPDGHALLSALNSSASASPYQASTSAPSAFAVLRAAIRPYFERYFSTPKSLTLFVLFVLLPTFSLFLRIRRRRMRLSVGSGIDSRMAEDVRRRLGGVQKGSVWRSIWEEAVRAVSDTVRMGGRGLV